MSNQVVDKLTGHKLSLFSTGCLRPKNLPTYALVLACMIAASTGELRADGYTVTFNDTSETPFVTISGTSTQASITSSCNVEFCAVYETPFVEPAPRLDEHFNIGEAGSSPTLSDRVDMATDISSTFLLIQLASDNPHTPIRSCALFGCSAFEGGAPITAGIDWPNGTTTDTFIFLSDADPVATPEPSSILLLLIGFGGIGSTKLRGKGAARRKWLS